MNNIIYMNDMFMSHLRKLMADEQHHNFTSLHLTYQLLLNNVNKRQ